MTKNYFIEDISENALDKFWDFIFNEFKDVVGSDDFPIQILGNMRHNQISIIKKVVFNDTWNFQDRNMKIPYYSLPEKFIKHLEEEKNIKFEKIVNKGLYVFWNEVSKSIDGFNFKTITKEGKEEIEKQKKELLNYLEIWISYNISDAYVPDIRKLENEENKF